MSTGADHTRAWCASGSKVQILLQSFAQESCLDFCSRSYDQFFFEAGYGHLQDHGTGRRTHFLVGTEVVVASITALPEIFLPVFRLRVRCISFNELTVFADIIKTGGIVDCSESPRLYPLLSHARHMEVFS